MRPPDLETGEGVGAVVRRALDEDAAEHDVTTDAVVPADLHAEAELLARAPGVVAGLDAVAAAFRQTDPGVVLDVLCPDGSHVQPNEVIARVSGPLASLLRAERVALNFLQQLSGTATLTRRFVDLAGGTAVFDTRKTVPGLRSLQRAAVRAGGGVNHRPDLASAILIKDNHVAAAGGTTAAIRAARQTGLPVEVEVESLAELEAALAERAEVILLDNMAPPQVARAVRLTAGRAVLEVSGGVTLATVAAYAGTGVDRVSIGALTHSAPALDVSMEVTKTWRSR